MKPITPKTIADFQSKIFLWWKEYKRILPWRETTNPYYILISEVMLQQTQVNRTIEKYLEFIDRFPTIESLAEAETAEVLRYWSGLGYNRRALWLQEAVQQIKEKGYFPETPEELIKLKGIGPYSSKSILIFAFNQDLATIDTNIRRILIAEQFAKENTKEKELFEIASKMVPSGKSRDWHNALMDYGSLELTAAKTGIKPTSSQPKYKSSKRFYRGVIVKYLTIKNDATERELVSNCDIPKELLTEILQSLTKDGLIIKKKKRYSLP